MEDKQVSHVRGLAERLYVELVARRAAGVTDASKLAEGAENLAALSFLLADAFYATEEAIIARTAPKTTFKLGSADIAEWSK